MGLEDFVLARVDEEEAGWRAFGLKDGDSDLAVEKGMRGCAEKRRAVKAFKKKPSRHLRAQLEIYALAYYHHPDYDDDWRPRNVPRWST